MLDLSLVTDTLRQILSDALAASPLWGGGPAPFPLAVSGQHPERPGRAASRLRAEPVSVPHRRGQVPGELLLDFAGRAVRRRRASSRSRSNRCAWTCGTCCPPSRKTSYVHEQQVLSVAMRALHEHGTLKIAAPTPLPDR